MPTSVGGDVHRFSHLTNSAPSAPNVFANNKDVLDQQDELICPAEVYLSCVMENLPEDLQTGSRALEVGPGNGTLLLGLSERYGQVLGMDSSSTMLAATADAIAHQPAAKHIKLMQGDFLASQTNHSSMLWLLPWCYITCRARSIFQGSKGHSPRRRSVIASYAPTPKTGLPQQLAIFGLALSPPF